MGKSFLGNIPNTHIRDHQRKKLYSAEDTCSFWQHLFVLSLDETKELVKSISKWANIKSPTIKADGHMIDEHQIAYATPDKIVLPFPLTKTLPYITHEMAHVINYNSSHADHHGEYYATTYLNVVKEFIDESAYYELKNAFDQWGVKYINA